MPSTDKAKIAAYKKQYMADPENRAKANAYRTEWQRRNREKNRERIREYDRQYYLKRRRAVITDKICKKRGITPDQYWELIAAADGKCDICDRPFGKKGPCIDHCHKTGVVRGVLCTRCNTAEGHLGTIEICEKLLDYMRKHEVRDDPIGEKEYGSG